MLRALGPLLLLCAALLALLVASTQAVASWDAPSGEAPAALADTPDPLDPADSSQTEGSDDSSEDSECVVPLRGSKQLCCRRVHLAPVGWRGSERWHELDTPPPEA